jgi:NAD(P)-dependent dehydrogenase (short-subunit alcohol dehydrogenase family)
MDNAKIWLVTGASQGLGLSLVKALLQNGQRVIAASRSTQAFLSLPHQENLLALEVNITNEQSVSKALQTAISTFGTVDVLVNNAGYGQLGTLEELSHEEVGDNFEVNVFGMLHLIRSVMPYMRRQGSGHIINIASIAGLLGSFPGWGIYCATKFAVAGLTESLSAEAAEFCINATVVYPGYFRTGFLSTGSLRTPLQPMQEYTAAREVERAHKEDIMGNQPGDPEKAAQAIMQLAAMPRPPLHFFMGSDAVDMAEHKISVLQADLQAHHDLSLSTNF